jgi:hypothetical protein
MKDLSMHILDVVENSLSAGADRIRIKIEEDTGKDLLLLEISDNGMGMDAETAKRVTDPFYTTRSTRRVGLGIPLLVQAARECNGDLRIETERGKGTTVTATFRHSHIDMKPMGDLKKTLFVMIATHPDTEFTFEYVKQNHSYVLDTGEIKKELQGIPMHSPEAIKILKDTINRWLHNLRHMIR